MTELDLLILGAGWTGTFLMPLAQSRKLEFAATTTNGREVAGFPTIEFKFDPAAPEEQTRTAIAALPRAKTVLITFPLTGNGPSKFLVESYTATHQTSAATASTSSQFRFIQLGSTGIWQSNGQTFTTDSSPWVSRHSPYNTQNPRAVAEDELISLGGCILNLSGLWGGSRCPKNWIARVAATKEQVKGKTSLHLIHGEDVARAVLTVAAASPQKWEAHGKGQRWMLTDGFVYDWWALLTGWGQENKKEEQEISDHVTWVWESMEETGVKALPRSMEVLGRAYDAKEFWRTWGLVPVKSRV
ncbi:hypothetical protein QBC42DRAFT_201916 [Cladorrhinum samala]|uniref:NAD(P)-binding protein n=1 Tax=Cladorrhinum samala TaxID=585594 RepID=A0AAV9HPV0_9PEZI|nr:hypothetical protein QBC42DRAFT_201916 [Cladorrhinum samala]